jgi:hypothetical protein
MTEENFERLQAVVFGMMQLARDMEDANVDTEFSQRLAMMTANAGIILCMPVEKKNA